MKSIEWLILLSIVAALAVTALLVRKSTKNESDSLKELMESEDLQKFTEGEIKI